MSADPHGLPLAEVERREREERRVERVARAICEAQGVGPEEPCFGLGYRIPVGESWPAWRVRIEMAEAAIAAYPEPEGA